MKKHTCDSRSNKFGLQSCDAKKGAIAPRLKYGLDLLSRGLVSAGIVVMVLMIARGLQDNRSFGRATATANEGSQGEPQLNEIGAIIDGQWQFAGMPWSVTIKQVSADEATRIIESTLPAQETSLTSESESIEVYDILQALNAETSENGPYTLHRINSDSFRVVAFAPKLNPKSIFLVRAMQLLESGKWNFVELQPTTGPQAQSPEGEHLLPVDPGNKRLAARSDASGRLVAELFDSSAPISQMQQVWHIAGWQVGEPQGSLGAIVSPKEEHSSVTDVSLQGGAANEILICTKGDSVVAAISQNSGAGDSQMLLLLRLEK